MDFKQLRAFLAVVDAGNVTRAAEMLHLVQPAVTRQIQMLEESLGVRLFGRERQGMVLTNGGHSLESYARRVMLELDRARAEIAGASAGVGGLVTLGLLPSSIDALASMLVAQLAATFPGIQVRIAMGYSGTLQEWLHSGEIDVALLYGAARSPDVQTTPLIEEPLWIIGLPGAKLRSNKPVPLVWLKDKPLVLPSAPHGIRALVDHACAVSNLDLVIAAETNALSVQRSLVLGGHGLTILPPMAVADDLKAGKLVGAPLCGPVLTRTIVLGISTQHAIRKHVRCTIELLIACAKRAVEDGVWLQGRWLEKLPTSMEE